MSGIPVFVFLAMTILITGSFGRLVGHKDAARAAATTASPVPKVLIGNHNLVYIVRTDGCYSVQLSNQEMHALKSHHDGHKLRTKLSGMVEHAVSTHEIDHHTIDREHSDVQQLCADLPVYRFTMTNHN